ncbi:hypothetical protein OBP_115 [Pseudomonas phage OBP]|uniref:hypothetical protein n=1 Tax=Pseudomonas phage OBP TaxID=1124849 RepID=UPI000240D4A1|nr:hypothetical protein OBP_115 [Pseudomonas phage OBP]AEV89552.1 hypothetical protein OBP_115 [Pseudomonas phage OBP]
MTYANSDNYLLLKQLLVALKLKHLGSIVEVGNIEITKDGGLTDKICELMATMEADFTLPYALLRDMPVHIDMYHILDRMPALHDTIITDDAMAPSLDDKDGLYRLVFSAPDIEGFGIQAKGKLNSYSNTRLLAGRLVEAASLGLTRVRKWAEKSDDPIPLTQMLTLLNAVEIIDWLFAYTNDYYGVPENDLKRE